MRDAFAQLLAQNLQSQALPAEALWQAQMRNQMPPPQLAATNPGGADITGEFATPLPKTLPQDPNLAFPVAPQGPGSTEYQPQKLPKPFPNARSVEVKPYELPTQKDKKPSKKKGKD